MNHSEGINKNRIKVGAVIAFLVLAAVLLVLWSGQLNGLSLQLGLKHTNNPEPAEHSVGVNGTEQTQGFGPVVADAEVREVGEPMGELLGRYEHRQTEYEQYVVPWERQHGYIPLDQRSVYEGYSISTLEALGDEGDLAALYVLAKKLDDVATQSTENPDRWEHYNKRAKAIREEAITLGATEPLVSAGRMTERGVSGLFRGTDEEIKPEFIQAATYYYAALKLGDLRAPQPIKSMYESEPAMLKKHWPEIDQKSDDLVAGIRTSQAELGIETEPQMPEIVEWSYQWLLDNFVEVGP